MSMEAQVELQAEADRGRHQGSSTSESLREAQAACQQAESEVERLQGTVKDLQQQCCDCLQAGWNEHGGTSGAASRG